VSTGDLLIVDDDSELTEILAEVLRKEGHTVRVARNGRDGLHKLHERLPDLVLLDVEMPVLNGPEMAYRMFIHDVGAERVPILLLSGIADFDLIVAEVGTPYFLAKPYHLNQVLALVIRALDERRHPTPERAAPM
jgi:DNA-binding response OmpR family regulator